jgi:cephalosporin hydroxylase
MTDEQVIHRFHDIFYSRATPWAANKWMGISTLENPLDAWITQEIIAETKPDFIIECGTLSGGSAALWATILAQVNPAGRVISIDLEDKTADAKKLPIVQERVDFIIGGTTAVDIVDQVKAKVGKKKVMVILDSDHRKAHVSSELKIYSQLIPVGGYLIVQATNINGHPTAKGWGAGPMEAVVEFLQGTKKFEADVSRERMLMSFSPSGYLKRVR